MTVFDRRDGKTQASAEQRSAQSLGYPKNGVSHDPPVEPASTQYASHSLPIQDRRQYPVSPVDTSYHGNPTIITGQSTPPSSELRLNTDFSHHESGLSKELEFGHYDAMGQHDYAHRNAMSENIPARTSSVKSLGASLRSLSPASAASSPGVGPLADITPLPSPLGSQSSSWINMPPAALHVASPQSPVSLSSHTSPSSGGFASASNPGRRKQYGADQTHLEQARSSLDASISKPRSYSNRSASDHIPVPRIKSIVVSSAHSPPSVASPLIREEYVAPQRGITVTPVKPPSPPKSNVSANDSSESESPTAIQRRKQAAPQHFQARMVRSNRLQEWVGIRQLGFGTFSTVMLATSDLASADKSEERMDPNSLVAVKICEHGPAGGADEKKIEASLKRELEILKCIHHPSLVHLRAVNVLETRAYLVLDYSAGGDLFELASLKLKVLVPSLIQRIFAELIDAVSYLHEHYIVHRDIKLENVLVNPRVSLLPTLDYATYPYPIVTLTDLGLGRMIPHPPESPMLSTRCGSEDYAAPELLIGQEYDGRQTDTWALGVLLYALMEGRLPFDPIPGARRQSPTTHRIARCEWQWIRWGDRDGDWDGGIWVAEHQRDARVLAAANGDGNGNADPQPAREELLRRGSELEGARLIVEGLLKRVTRRWALSKVREQPWAKDAIQVEGGIRQQEWCED